MAERQSPGDITAPTATNRFARPVAFTVAGVFLLVGILGFIPGVTDNVDQLAFAGDESQAMLLGVFQVSVLHNIVHLAFGGIGLAMATTVGGSTWFLLGGGAIYLVLWIYGMVIDFDSDANFVPLNTADNWLHLALAVGMIGAGLALRMPRRA